MTNPPVYFMAPKARITGYARRKITKRSTHTSVAHQTLLSMSRLKAASKDARRSDQLPSSGQDASVMRVAAQRALSFRSLCQAR